MMAFGTRLLLDRVARSRRDADDGAAQHPGAAGRGAWSARLRQYPVTSGRWFLLIWLLALIILAANHPGRMFFDTKLGVDINAAGFYARLWHLWNPLDWFGTLQNQYIGYAFPMAPFYLVGQLLHVPNWITERIWLSLLIAVGYSGLVRLAAALRIGSERSRLLQASCSRSGLRSRSSLVPRRLQSCPGSSRRGRCCRCCPYHGAALLSGRPHVLVPQSCVWAA